MNGVTHKKNTMNLFGCKKFEICRKSNLRYLHMYVDKLIRTNYDLHCDIVIKIGQNF